MSETKNIAFKSPPASIQARRQLIDAKRFLETGKFSEAKAVCRELLSVHPDYVEALTTFGHIHLVEKDHDAALPFFMRASMLAGNDAAVLADLALVYFSLGSDSLARQTGELALSLSPSEDTARTIHLLLGQICQRQRDFDAAIHYLERSGGAAGPSPEALKLLGLCHISARNRDEACSALSEAMKNDLSALDNAEALFRLSHLSDATRAEVLLGELDAIEGEAPLSDTAEGDDWKCVVYRDFARARLLDQMGLHDSAWQKLEAANSRLGGEYREVRQQLRDADEQLVERAQHWIYAGAPVDDISEKGPLSLFILGAPCSGKSTLEQMLGAVDGVAIGYDHELIQVAARETATTNGFLPLSFPGQLPTSMHRHFSKVFARETKARAGEAQVLTCTNSELLVDLGRIAETVQRMKVVFLKRDNDDCAFRIYEQYFSDGSNAYSYDVTAVYEQLEVFSRLSDAWAETLPGVCLHVSYEDLVSDPKATLRRVGNFCGIDISKTKLPDLGDDRGCAEPYRDKLESARSGAIAPLSGWAVPEL